MITPTCRICRAAWHLAPGIITTKPNGQATFARQPDGDDEVLQTWRAAVACPTGSILAPRGLKMPDGVFPQLLDERLYRLGYNDNATAGAHPYFIRSSTGQNIMIDGPRYVPKLVDFFEQQGGLDHVLLTHRDDVGASAASVLERGSGSTRTSALPRPRVQTSFGATRSPSRSPALRSSRYPGTPLEALPSSPTRNCLSAIR